MPKHELISDKCPSIKIEKKVEDIKAAPTAHTVWKFENFTIQILREINFSNLEVSNTAILSTPETPDFSRKI